MGHSLLHFSARCDGCEEELPGIGCGMSSPRHSREELLVAQKRLEEQIFRLQYPANQWDRNPPLLARLESALAGVRDALADLRES